MNDITVETSQLLSLPEPRLPITIRPGVLSDVPFMDSLQKLHSKQVGWMPTKQFEGKIKAGHVLVAEAEGNDERGTMNDEVKTDASAVHRSSFTLHRSPVGYLIGNDQYFKRDDVGIIYQMNVLPGRQRGLIGASLLKAQFERSAYGCRLYCCWCAQDIAANRFWEAMGFVPLAYRAGSEKKGPKGSARTHIFWQKRIRAGDTTTPWWFPSQTTGGAIREDRLVLPIPPGMHWSDAKPLILPGAGVPGSPADEPKQLPRPRQRKQKSPPVANPSNVLSGGLRFGVATPAEAEPRRAAKPVRVKQKNDPRLIAAARELRDRWLEQVNADPRLLTSAGKYEVARLAGPGPEAGEGARLLPAA